MSIIVDVRGPPENAQVVPFANKTFALLSTLAGEAIQESEAWPATVNAIKFA